MAGAAQGEGGVSRIDFVYQDVCCFRPEITVKQAKLFFVPARKFAAES